MATASRPETISWVKDLGAHHVIDHGKPIAAQVAALGIGAPLASFALGVFFAQRPPRGTWTSEILFAVCLTLDIKYDFKH